MITAGLTSALMAVAVLLSLPARPSAPARRRAGGRRILVMAVAATAVGTVALGGRLPVLVGVAGLGLLGVQRLRASRRRVASAALAASRVAEFCESVAAELASGAPTHRALSVAAAEIEELAPVAAAARLGADVPGAMRTLATQPGRHDLAVVAAAWQVSIRCGGGLAEPLERAAATLRERRRTARMVHAELAPARATAQLMAALPIVFLVAGSGLGGHPVAFLTTTTPGTSCLVAGLLLSYAGLAWLERIAGSVEQGPS